MLTSLLLNSKLDQAIVLASEETPPSALPHGVNFLSLGEGLKTSEATFVGIKESRLWK